MSNISKDKLEAILRDSIIDNEIESLPAQIDVVISDGKFSYNGEKSFDLDFDIPNTNKVKFTNIAVYNGFPSYVKPHDLYKIDRVKGYTYGLEGQEMQFYIVDRNYFVARENEMIVLKDIYIDRIDNSEYSMNNIYSLDKKAYGANHMFQVTDKNNEDNSLVIVMQKGGRYEDNSEWGLLDIDLLNIVKSRLSQFAENFDDEENVEARDYVSKAIESLEKRYSRRKTEGSLGKN